MLSKVKFDVITRGKGIWKQWESDKSGTKLCQKYYGERKKLNIINGIYSWMGKMYISFVCQIIIMLQSFKDYTKTFWLAWFFSKWGGIKKNVLSTDHLTVWNQLATSSATPLFDDLLFISTFRQFTWPPMIFFSARSSKNWNATKWITFKVFNVLQNQKLKNQLTISSDEYFQNSTDSLDNLQRRQQHSCN